MAAIVIFPYRKSSKSAFFWENDKGYYVIFYKGVLSKKNGLDKEE